jgi:hypothetical protein
MPASCSNHPTNEARFECVPCRRYLCYVCARRTELAHTTVDQCPRCGALVTPIGGLKGEGKIAAIARAEAVRKGLISRLGDVPLFLARPSVLLVLAGLALIEAPLRWSAQHAPGILSIVALVLVVGFEAVVYFHIVERSAFGEDDLEAPELDNFVEYIVLPFLRYVVALLPLAVGVIWFASVAARDLQSGVSAFEHNPRLVLEHHEPLIMIVVGLVLWPLLTMIAALTRSLVQMLNPLRWYETLKTLKLDYAIGCVGFYTVLGLEIFVWTPLRVAFLQKVNIWGVSTVIFLFLGYVPMALRGRILGTTLQEYVE